MNKTASCIYAALHVIGIVILWVVAIGIAMACAGPSAGWCAVGSLIAAGIISVFIIGSFLAAYKKCMGKS